VLPVLICGLPELKVLISVNLIRLQNTSWKFNPEVPSAVPATPSGLPTGITASTSDFKFPAKFTREFLHIYQPISQYLARSDFKSIQEMMKHGLCQPMEMSTYRSDRGSTPLMDAAKSNSDGVRSSIILKSIDIRYSRH
jgi:hypothetical protein